MARIFLCHASEDKPQVRDVYQRLKALGFNPWLNEEDILPGQDWDYEIEMALEQSDFVMVFLSERSVGKVGYVQREFRRAMYHAEEMPEGYIHTIPIKLDGCTVPRRFSRHQWANLSDDGAFDRIIRALYHGLQQRGKQVPTPLETPPAKPNTTITFPPSITNSIGMEFVLIPAGEFMMGTTKEQLDAIASGDQNYRNWIKNETPQHRVIISQPFYMGKYEVTQAQWQAVMGDNPSYFKGDNHPVERVAWDDAQQFIQRLNEREKQTNGILCRLPTEAEWEYAARAGTTTLYSFGNNEAHLKDYAWYIENSGGRTHPVGKRQPNIWGLYDMHGNVAEWVQDWYAADYYTQSPLHDPQGPATGADRVIRGGSWGYDARYVRAAYRGADDPGSRDEYLGFRCLSSGVSR